MEKGFSVVCQWIPSFIIWTWRICPDLENCFSAKEIMQRRRLAQRITLIDEQFRLNTTDLIEMPGLFPGSLIKRQVLILDESLTDMAEGRRPVFTTNQSGCSHNI